MQQQQQRWVRRGTRLRRNATLVALAALVLLAPACGNSEKKATPPQTTIESGESNEPLSGENVPVDAPGVSDSEIRVGGVASVENPIGAKAGDSFVGVKAYFDYINSQGGIYGRTLTLAAERDDKTANNSAEVTGLLTEDDVFAVLPVATLLFTGAQQLVDENVPTFGWTINTEWQGSEEEPKLNLFGQTGSYVGIGESAPFWPWIVKEADASKVGLLSYQVPQSSQCADGIRSSFDEFGERVDVEIAFRDQSLAYGVADLSVQVSQMKEADVDFVLTCMDSQGLVTLAKEMKKQNLDAVQFMPNSYDQELMEEFGDLFEGSYARTDFTQFELEDKPPGLELYLEWIEKQDISPSENSLVGWLNAALFVTGLQEAGPEFDRQKLIDAINDLTDFDADGLIRPVDWTMAHDTPPSLDSSCNFISQVQDSEFVPVFSKPGKPFVCAVVEDDDLGTRYTD